jgi:tRNA-uridine 2-sulfurtransferase
MQNPNKKYKALALVSGGLDSLLAAKLIMEQGVCVEGINFFTGFTGDHDYYCKRFQDGSHGAKWVCDQLGIKLHIINIVDEFKSVMHNPKYGYGANLNPCLDCKLFMIMQAKQWMEQHGFDFLISGEVLGQRPKSQRKDTLPLAAKATSNLIVRPLSAKLLAPTLPELNGWINRELLCNFSGRSRQPQMKLVQKFGFKEFPQPGGGCLLTDPNFCKRLQDLWDHRVNRDYNLDDILLLRLGRHLRIKPDLKIIVGRDEVENNFIEKFSAKYTLLQTINYPGALLLLDGKVIENELMFLAGIAVHFSKGCKAKSVMVLVRKPKTEHQILEVTSS